VPPIGRCTGVAEPIDVIVSRDGSADDIDCDRLRG